MSGENILFIAFNIQVDFSYFDMKQKGKKKPQKTLPKLNLIFQ